MMWELGSDLASQYFTAWTVCVRLAWQVPMATHTYFLDQLLGCGISSVRMNILARYCKFFRGLMASPSMEVVAMSFLPGGQQAECMCYG